MSGLDCIGTGTSQGRTAVSRSRTVGDHVVTRIMRSEADASMKGGCRHPNFEASPVQAAPDLPVMRVVDRWTSARPDDQPGALPVGERLSARWSADRAEPSSCTMFST